MPFGSLIVPHVEETANPIRLREQIRHYLLVAGIFPNQLEHSLHRGFLDQWMLKVLLWQIIYGPRESAKRPKRVVYVSFSGVRCVSPKADLFSVTGGKQNEVIQCVAIVLGERE